MNILVIPVQTVSDIITNSSSEVFILDTGKTCEETVGSMNWRTLLKNNYILKEPLYDIAEEFLENYNGPEPTVWNIGKRYDVRGLDGKVLVVSYDDNSIPYDTWDKINNLFNGWNVHLG